MSQRELLRFFSSKHINHIQYETTTNAMHTEQTDLLSIRYIKRNMALRFWSLFSLVLIALLLVLAPSALSAQDATPTSGKPTGKAGQPGQPGTRMKGSKGAAEGAKGAAAGAAAGAATDKPTGPISKRIRDKKLAMNEILEAKATQCEADADSKPECTASEAARKTCVLKCTSADCFAKIFKTGLESGEADEGQTRRFKDCTRREQARASRTKDRAAEL